MPIEASRIGGRARRTLGERLVSRKTDQVTTRSRPAVVEYIPQMLGGMEKYGRSLCSELQHGADVTLVTMDASGQEARAVDADLKHVRMHRLRPREMPFGRLSRPASLAYKLYLRPYLELAGLLRREQPDVVHIHFGLHLLDWLVPVLAPKHCRSVLTAHDPLPHRWLLPRRLHPLERRIMKWRYHQFDQVIVHSNEGAAILAEVFGMSRSKIRVIPHGSDVRTLAPLLDAPRMAGFTLLGQLRQNKCVVEAISAYQSLSREVRSTWPLVVAGRPESASYRKEIVAQAECDPVGIELRPEHLDAEEFDQLLGRYAYTLLPYQHFNSMSGVLMRAMAMGTLPIANLDSGLRAQAPAELRSVAIGSDGLGEALRRAAELFGSPGAYRELQNAVVAFSREYGWEKVAASHLALFSEEFSRAESDIPPL